MAKFQKGQSGNPNGRPRITEEQRQAKKIAKELAGEAMDTLALIMRNGKSDAKFASASVSAARTIVEYAEGKPHQSIDMKTEVTRYVINSRAEPVSPEKWQQQHAPKETIQ